MDRFELHEFLHAVPSCACMRRVDQRRDAACRPDPQCLRADQASGLQQQATPQNGRCACGAEKLAQLPRCYACILRAREGRRASVASELLMVVR